MNTLKTTPESLKAKASQLQLQGDKMAKYIEKMIKIVESIHGATWSGEAATKYKHQFDQLNDDAKRMRKLLDETHEKLEQIAALYQSAEDQNQSVASSLPVDIF